MTTVVHLEREWLSEPTWGNAFITTEISTCEVRAGAKVIDATVDLFEYSTTLHMDFSVYDSSDTERIFGKLDSLIGVLTRFRESLDQTLQTQPIPEPRE